MKLFLDTADTALISKHFQSGLIDGITTNPTLIMKSGRNPWDVYKELETIGLTDISMEVVGNASEMVREGRKLSGGFGDIATIKVPCTPDGLKACYDLVQFGIRVNVTLIFSVSQAILAVKAGARYLSPFVGRVDDQRFGGCNLIKRIREVLPVHICAQYNNPEILSASIRSVGDVEHSFAMGADIVTMPPKIFNGMYNHILTDVGVDIFERDWQSVQLTKEKQSNG
tara:strand:- start:1257 stop:1937 length:681 start_codon:yes stop_codon:yes gene_type:complete